MAMNAEQLNIILAARDKEFTKAMDRSERRVASFARKSGKNLSKTSASFDALGVAAKRLGPAIAAAFSVQAIRGAIDAAAEIGKLSRLAGVSSDEFQILAATSTQFGIGQEKLADILKDVNDKFGDFTETGAGPLKDFFEFIAPQVGLTAAAFADLSSDQKLGAYVSALEKANVTQSEMTFYMEAIASDSTALVGAFEKNSAAIDEMREKAKSLGIVLDKSLIENAQQAKGDLDLMSRVINANLSSALISLAPLLVGAAEGIAAISTAIRNFGFQGVSDLLDADGLRDLADQYKGLEKELGRFGQAQSALDAVIAKYDTTSQQAVDAREELKNAEDALTKAVEGRQRQQSAEAAITTSVANIQSEIAANTELAKVQAMTAEAAERHRIAEQRGAYEKGLLNNAAIQQGIDLNDLSEETILLVNDLGAKWEGAAMSASKILNPVKAAKVATKEVAETADQMVQSLIDASPVFSRMGVNVQELSSIGDSVSRSLETAFMNMSGSVEDNVKAMASSVIKELYRVLVVQRLVSGITGALGLSAPTTSLRPVMRPMASGGAVTAGQQYMTGEHGRELFVPKVNGRVLSAAQTNNATSGPRGEGVTVIQNNTFGSGVTRAEVSSLLPRMVEATKQAVLDEKLRGGSYGRGFG
jgi:exonuclease VII small subunit